MQKKTMKLALLLVLCLAFVFVLAGCPNDNPTPDPKPDPAAKTYTYHDYVSQMATLWNPHRYESNDDSYPNSFIQTGFYDVLFKDGSNYTEYEFVPAMAAGMPENVTDEYRDAWDLGNDQYRAWKITLNPNAVWENGDPINADTYLYSFKQLIDPKKNNYRASDWIGTSDFAVQGGYEYYWSDRLEKQCVYYGDNSMTWETTPMYINVEETIVFFGNTVKAYYDGGYGSYFDITDEDGNVLYNFYEQYAGKGYVLVESQDVIDALLVMSKRFGDNNPEAWREWLFYDYQHEHAVWENVGLLKTGEYEIVFILNKNLGGEVGETYAESTDAFYLFYNLSGNFIVYEPYYEACANWDGGVYSTTYCTTKETTMSYGPYKMTSFTRDAYMKYERNETWFGYSDSRYDGMYQTDVIDTVVVKENKTVKQMFMKGELETWGLGTDDFNDYRSSEYAFYTPSDSVFFLVLTGHEKIMERQTETVNKSMILNENFRKAMALFVNKDKFCASVSPSRSAAYGIFGTTYVIEPGSGETYRSTDVAKQALVDYYGIEYGEGKLYATLDEAYEALSGYDAELAREYFLKAYDEEVAKGLMNENMTVEIDYAASVINTFMSNTMNYLNESLDEVLKGTVLEGKIRFIISSAVGDQWNTYIKDGTRDACLCGWTGARMNPFGLVELYVDPDRAYDAEWYDGTQTKLTIEIDGEEVTLTMLQWSQAIQGSKVTDADGVVRSYGSTDTDYMTRTKILAECEKVILASGSYIPMMQDAGLSLHTAKWDYITDNYNALLGYGGVSYIRYNYSDAEWEDFVKQQGGNLETLYKAA